MGGGGELVIHEARFVISTAVAKERHPQGGQKISEHAVLPFVSGTSQPLAYSRHLKMVTKSLLTFLLCVCVCVLCVCLKWQLIGVGSPSPHGSRNRLKFLRPGSKCLYLRSHLASILPAFPSPIYPSNNIRYSSLWCTLGVHVYVGETVRTPETVGSLTQLFLPLILRTFLNLLLWLCHLVNGPTGATCVLSLWVGSTHPHTQLLQVRCAGNLNAGPRVCTST